MRYGELVEARVWKHFMGRERDCYLVSRTGRGAEGERSMSVRVTSGETSTGRSRVFYGFFISVTASSGETWLGEHRHTLRGALREAERLLREDGWTLPVAGLDPRWYETGLSGNSGYGYHPAFDGPLHILEPWLPKRESA